MWHFAEGVLEEGEEVGGDGGGGEAGGGGAEGFFIGGGGEGCGEGGGEGGGVAEGDEAAFGVGADDVALAATVEGDGDGAGGLSFDEGAGEGFVERGGEDHVGVGVEFARGVAAYGAEVYVRQSQGVEGMRVAQVAEKYSRDLHVAILFFSTSQTILLSISPSPIVLLIYTIITIIQTIPLSFTINPIS